MKNVLIIDDKVPDPHFGAGFPRAYRLLLTLLGLGYRVNFIPTVKDSLKHLDLPLLESNGIHVYDDVQKVPHVDVAILSRPHNVHYYLPKVFEHHPHAKTIYDTEALWYRRYDLQLSITGRLPGWAYRYDELGLARKVDLCFVVNDVEKGILEEAGAKKVTKLAHALKPHRHGLPYRERKNFLVVGGLLEEDSSNEDGLWEYLEKSWVPVHEELKVPIDVTGKATSPRLKSHGFPEVNLMGHVNDLVPLYESRRVFVAMTRFSTGIPWKVHEAMAHGIPCLISKLLADQLQLSWDDEAMVAETPEEATEKSLELYNDHDLWDHVREKGFKLIERDCNVEKFKHILSTSLDELLS